MNSIAENQNQSQSEQNAPEKNQPIKQSQDGRQLHHQESNAARLLQRTYRGHRERRQLRGLSLDPSTRWTEAIKEAQYLALTAPHPHSSKPPPNPNPPSLNRTISSARQNWLRAGKIARRAGGDEESSFSSSSLSENNDAPSPSSLSPSQQQQARRQKRLAEKQERIRHAKQMDLSYFLELVDVKHRYGSNLRKYHQVWKEASTGENFFYWLDEGEGKGVVVEKCGRDRLEGMQVRYFNREERRLYEVVVDKEGKLCWRKDGRRVDTSDGWKDSIRGIVRADDPTPPWAHRPMAFRGSSGESGLSSGEQEVEERDGATSMNPSSKPKATVTKEKREDLQAASSPTSPTQQPPPPPPLASQRHTTFQDLFFSHSGPASPTKPDSKKTPKKKQIWIFVADTNNNLYIGIKQSGAFQHSSFLRGSRISAAGLITVRDGQLRILQPRSGHYRTPGHNLRVFIKSLQARGVDMSMTAVGGSYAAMVGIETYMKTKGRLKGLREGWRGLSLKGEEGREGGR